MNQQVWGCKLWVTIHKFGIFHVNPKFHPWVTSRIGKKISNHYIHQDNSEQMHCIYQKFKLTDFVTWIVIVTMTLTVTVNMTWNLLSMICCGQPFFSVAVSHPAYQYAFYQRQSHGAQILEMGIGEVEVFETCYDSDFDSESGMILTLIYFDCET